MSVRQFKMPSVTARRIAEYAHRGQVDKAGEDYIEHVRRVASTFDRTSDACVVAWLHDVVEDTAIDLSLIDAVFGPTIAASVDALTRRDGEAPSAYYQRVRDDYTALHVKRADIRDNCDVRRLARLNSKTVLRLIGKYANALDALDAPPSSFQGTTDG